MLRKSEWKIVIHVRTRMSYLRMEQVRQRKEFNYSRTSLSNKLRKSEWKIIIHVRTRMSCLRMERVQLRRKFISILIRSRTYDSLLRY